MNRKQLLSDKKRFCINIGGSTIGIECKNLSVYQRCKPFIKSFSENVPFITVTYSEILSESVHADIELIKQNQYQGVALTPDIGYLESLAILRKLADALLERNTLLIHGAAISVNGSAFLFSAPSGTGKTTHICKWLKQLPDAFAINGDKPFIKFPEDITLPPLACGSPWAGKENMYTDVSIPLKAIIYMERAENNYIEEISFSQAFPLILQQTYRPDSEGKMRRTINLLQRLNTLVKFYKFQCNNFSDNCFDVAYEALVRNNS